MSWSLSNDLAMNFQIQNHEAATKVFEIGTKGGTGFELALSFERWAEVEAIRNQTSNY